MINSVITINMIFTIICVFTLYLSPLFRLHRLQRRIHIVFISMSMKMLGLIFGTEQMLSKHHLKVF